MILPWSSFCSFVHWNLLFFLKRIATPLEWCDPWEKTISPPHSFFQRSSSSGEECVSCNKKISLLELFKRWKSFFLLWVSLMPPVFLDWTVKLSIVKMVSVHLHLRFTSKVTPEKYYKPVFIKKRKRKAGRKCTAGYRETHTLKRQDKSPRSIRTYTKFCRLVVICNTTTGVIN